MTAVPNGATAGHHAGDLSLERDGSDHSDEHHDHPATGEVVVLRHERHCDHGPHTERGDPRCAGIVNARVFA